MNKKALAFAMKKHKGQVRKFNPDVPYIEHLKMVHHILSLVTDDENVLTAGLLHDIIEDTDTTLFELIKEFGSDVALLVFQVTKNKEGKFPIYSKDAMVIKLADMLDNLSDCPNEDYIKKRLKWMRELK